jgi:hypothetical protein
MTSILGFHLARLKFVVLRQRFDRFTPGSAIFPEYVLRGLNPGVFIQSAGRDDYRGASLR